MSRCSVKGRRCDPSSIRRICLYFLFSSPVLVPTSRRLLISSTFTVSTWRHAVFETRWQSSYCSSLHQISASARRTSLDRTIRMTSILRAKYPFLAPSLAVDHLVVGAGVIVSSVTLWFQCSDAAIISILVFARCCRDWRLENDLSKLTPTRRRLSWRDIARLEERRHLATRKVRSVLSPSYFRRKMID